MLVRYPYVEFSFPFHISLIIYVGNPLEDVIANTLSSYFCDERWH